MKQKWILVAEDDHHDADLTLRALKMDPSPVNGDVIIAQDGSEALDCLYRRNDYQTRDNSNPTFVLLDLQMPKVEGQEVLRQIKADSRLKMIPVIMFTSSREEIDLARCYSIGANAYVVKPLDSKEFTATLKQLRTFWLTVNEPPPE
jgi:CheY-like chemotaxis protein